MQVVKHIQQMMVALIAAIVMVMAPAAASQPSHACCVEGTASAALMVQSGLSLHIQHLQKTSPSEHKHGTPSSQPCRILCCANFAASSYLLAAAPTFEPARPVTRPLYHVTPVSASPVSPKLHTPPPRLSLFV